MTDQSLPEVRQCADPDHRQFGAVAVNAGDNRWAVMNPRNGGHWADDSETADWKVVT
jgi:hypothetical protein